MIYVDLEAFTGTTIFFLSVYVCVCTYVCFFLHWLELDLFVVTSVLCWEQKKNQGKWRKVESKEKQKNEEEEEEEKEVLVDEKGEHISLFPFFIFKLPLPFLSVFLFSSFDILSFLMGFVFRFIIIIFYHFRLFGFRVEVCLLIWFLYVMCVRNNDNRNNDNNNVFLYKKATAGMKTQKVYTGDINEMERDDIMIMKNVGDLSQEVAEEKRRWGNMKHL